MKYCWIVKWWDGRKDIYSNAESALFAFLRGMQFAERAANFSMPEIEGIAIDNGWINATALVSSGDGTDIQKDLCLTRKELLD